MSFFAGHSFLNILWLGYFLLTPDLLATKQHSDTIVLRNELQIFAPVNFFIADVSDDRADKNNIGHFWAYPPGQTKPLQMAVDFKGGGLYAVREFFSRNVSVNKSLRPVTIDIRKFEMTEKVGNSGIIEGKADVVLGFYINFGEISLHLTDYQAVANYTRAAGTVQQVEPLLRNLLVNGIRYLDKWITRESGSDARLAQKVEVSFADYNQPDEGDTIYYSIKRPLRWSDFKSVTASKSYAAQVFPELGYDEQASVDSGIIRLRISLKVALAKSACWVKSGNQTGYVLNHEQRHFDIAKIASEYFKNKVASEKLPVYNYDGLVNVDFLDAYRKMDTLQKQYDDETEHGLNEAAQKRWNAKVDAENLVL